MLGGSVARVEDDRSPRGKVARTGYDSDAFIGQYRFRLDGQRQLRVSAQRQQDDDVWYPGSTRPATVAPAPTVTVHSPEQTRHLYELGYQLQGVGGQPLNVDVRLYQQRMDRQINGFHNTLQRDVNTNQAAFTTHGLDARADWQFVNYSGAVHCFALPHANQPGCAYNERAAKRSERIMRGFLAERFAAGR